ncbi:MAG: DUF2975 domain-containing protein [Streptosporangiaceae bacterium]
MATTQQRRRLTQPLETITAFFGTLLVLGVVAGAALTMFGSGSFEGFGRGAVICATQPNAGYDNGGPVSHLGVAPRPGASITINGALRACASHPSIGQRILFTLMQLPGLVVWATMLFLLWRVIVAARRDGPFTVRVAAAIRRLGWVVLAGNLAAGAVQGFSTDQLLNTMLTPRINYSDAINGLIHGLPVAVLVGAALLTFARIFRLGAQMDDDLQGTV